jgi:hypothetical protein
MPVVRRDLVDAAGRKGGFEVVRRDTVWAEQGEAHTWRSIW